MMVSKLRPNCVPWITSGSCTVSIMVLHSRHRHLFVICAVTSAFGMAGMSVVVLPVFSRFWVLVRV